MRCRLPVLIYSATAVLCTYLFISRLYFETGQYGVEIRQDPSRPSCPYRNCIRLVNYTSPSISPRHSRQNIIHGSVTRPDVVEPPYSDERALNQDDILAAEKNNKGNPSTQKAPAKKASKKPKDKKSQEKKSQEKPVKDEKAAEKAQKNTKKKPVDKPASVTQAANLAVQEVNENNDELQDHTYLIEKKKKQEPAEVKGVSKTGKKDITFTDAPPVTKYKHVLLYAYMRGGSSILGQIFSQNKDVLHWYEPLEPIYNSFLGLKDWLRPFEVTRHNNGSVREIPQFEKDYIAKKLYQLFECDFDNLPPEMSAHPIYEKSGPPLDSAYTQCVLQHARFTNSCLFHLTKQCPRNVGLSLQRNCHLYMEAARGPRDELHRYQQLTGDADIGSSIVPFTQYNTCVQKVRRRIKACKPILENACKNTHIHAGKVPRLHMNMLETMIQLNPKLKVVYSVRDPRGILNSVIRNELLFKGTGRSAKRESRLLCERMLEDYTISLELQKKYPGTILHTSYEDLSDKPMETVQRIYDFIEEPVSKDVSTFIETNMHGKLDSGAFSYVRKNASATARAWTHQMDPDMQDHVAHECAQYFKLTSLHHDKQNLS